MKKTESKGLPSAPMLSKLALSCLLAFAVGAHAAPPQSLVEAELVSGGTVVAELDASADRIVTRSTGGIYTWWVSETSQLSTGSYSVYARVALADGVTSPKNFNQAVIYGTQEVANKTIAINNRALQWVRVTSFDLKQIGGQLRVSDWSDPGLKIDKLAIVKDVFGEAELTANVSVVSDPQASGGRATSRTVGGIYNWWSPAASDMIAGDYDVFMRMRSADGAPHNFTGGVGLDGVAQPSVSVAVASTSYQWYQLNRFTYAGGAQQVLISDWSEPNLYVDAVRLVRRTPSDSTTAAQALFAGGANVLGPVEEVTFRGVPQNGYGQPITFNDVKNDNGLDALLDAGRMSVVRVNAGTTYAYFRQQLKLPDTVPKAPVYQIYMGTSTDGGKSFTIVPKPIIPVGTHALGSLVTAYDPQVVKRADGYYMVFEGAFQGKPCGFSAVAAYSADGVNNWQLKNIVLCGPLISPGPDNGPALGSVSTPAQFRDVDTGIDYLQWVSANGNELTSRHYQMKANVLVDQTAFVDYTRMTPYALPQAPASAWDGKNYGSGMIFYEDAHYYLPYEGANAYFATSQFALGISRTATPAVLGTWTRSTRNPYMVAEKADAPWIQYPSLVTLPKGDGTTQTYLYYNHGFPYWQPGGAVRSTFRRLIKTN